jgi:hypothetical protein
MMGSRFMPSFVAASHVKRSLWADQAIGLESLFIKRPNKATMSDPDKRKKHGDKLVETIMER